METKEWLTIVEVIADILIAILGGILAIAGGIVLAVAVTIGVFQVQAIDHADAQSLGVAFTTQGGPCNEKISVPYKQPVQ